MSSPAAQPRAPMSHDLKTWPQPFQASFEGKKGFEYRKADRDYQVGDTLCLREWGCDEPSMTSDYTGREITVTVTYILPGPDFGIPAGYCIMGIKPTPPPVASDLPTPADLHRSISEARGLIQAAIGQTRDLNIPHTSKHLWTASRELDRAAQHIRLVLAATPEPQEGADTP